MAAHKKGCRSHQKVQHAFSQDRNIWVLPQQRLEELLDRQGRNEWTKD